MPYMNRRSFIESSAVLAGSGGIATGAIALPEKEQPENSIGKTPHTRFAVNVEMWWTQLPFLERIRQAAALGFPAVEFWPYQGKDLAAIAQLTSDLKIEIAQFTAWGFTPGMNHPEN